MSSPVCAQSDILIYRNNYRAKASECHTITARKLDLPLKSTAPSINSDIPATRRASAHRYEQLTAASFGRILERGRSAGACEDAV